MTHLRPGRMGFSSCSMIFLMLIAIATLVVGCNKNKPEQTTTSAGPQTFASPEIACQTIYAAAKAGDTNTLLVVFGSGAKELLFSGDPVQDKAALDTFSDRYDQMHRWGRLTNGGLVLDIGADNYPLSIRIAERLLR